MGGTIRIRGARQHTLKHLGLDIHTGDMSVVTFGQRLYPGAGGNIVTTQVPAPCGLHRLAPGTGRAGPRP